MNIVNVKNCPICHKPGKLVDYGPLGDGGQPDACCSGNCYLGDGFTMPLDEWNDIERVDDIKSPASKIAEGDIVWLDVSFFHSTGVIPDLLSAPVKVLYVPQATGDMWHFELEDGSTYYLNPCSAEFRGIFKETEIQRQCRRSKRNEF